MRIPMIFSLCRINKRRVCSGIVFRRFGEEKFDVCTMRENSFPKEIKSRGKYERAQTLLYRIANSAAGQIDVNNVMVRVRTYWFQEYIVFVKLSLRCPLASQCNKRAHCESPRVVPICA